MENLFVAARISQAFEPVASPFQSTIRGDICEAESVKFF